MLSIIGTILAFVLIVWMVKQRYNLGIAMILGALVLGFASLKLTDVLYVVLYTLIDPLTLELTAIVALCGLWGHSLQKTGQIGAIINSFKKMLSNGRSFLALIPAIFVTMTTTPGGALISASIVGPEGDKLKLNAMKKTSVNLWFREAKFLIYPLGPGLILAAKLARVNLYDPILIQIPLFIVAVFIGYWASLRKIRFEPQKNRKKCNRY